MTFTPSVLSVMDTNNTTNNFNALGGGNTPLTYNGISTTTT